jgi:putative glutamine amidotransferase
MSQPLIGITTDTADDRLVLSRAYVAAVRRAGGVPVLLPCEESCAADYLAVCDAIIMSGGDDPATEQWGVATHPCARRMDPRRQAFEVALLRLLDAQPAKPVLGICLGMQLMALHAGGALDQYLPETLPTAGLHWGRVEHEVSGELGRGVVLSHHRQAVIDTGTLRAVAHAPDGIIEAVRDGRRPFYIGVQWHPERTRDDGLGEGLVRALVAAASLRRSLPLPSPTRASEPLAP